MSLKNLFSSAGGASSDVIETEVVSTASTRDVFEDNSCVALYRFEGDATDTGGNFNGTASNITYGTGKFGQGAVLNGTNSVFRLPYSSFPFIALDSFSFSIWIKRNNASEAGIMFINNLTGRVGSFISFNSSNNIVFSDGFYEHYSSLVCGNLSVGTWEHLVFTQQGDTRNVYQNGINVGTETSSLTRENSTYLEMFTLSVNGTFYSSFNGSADQFRIFNRALTAEEVAFLYVEEKTVVKETVRELKDLVDPFLDKSGVALYQFNGDATDTSGNFNGTASNVTYGAGKFGQGAVFNGSSSNVKIAQDAYSSNAFSVSCWVKFNALGLDQRFVVCNSDTYSKYFRINIRTDNKISAFYGASNSAIIISPSTYTTGVFYHIAMSAIQGSNLSLYINGVLIQSIANGGTGYVANLASEFGAWVGSGRGGVSEILNGSIDQFRIFNRALTAEDIAVLYEEKEDLTLGKDTQHLIDPFGDKSGVALYEFNGDAKDTGGSFNGTASNVTYGAGKFGQCVQSTVSSSNVSFGVHQFNVPKTLSFWAKGSVVVENGQNNQQYPTIKFIPTSFRLFNGTNAVINLPLSYDTSVFVHICVTINYPSVVVYINGVMANSGSMSNQAGTTPFDFGLWDVPGYNETLNGSIDQFRIFNRALTAEEVAILYAEKKPQVSTINLTDPFGDNSAVALYKMDGNALDAGGSYNGTASGVTYEEGKLGHCARISLGGSISTGLSLTSVFTISCFIKITDNVTNYSAHKGLFTTISDGPYQGVVCTLIGGTLSLTRMAGSIPSGIAISTTGVDDGNWHHLCVGYNGTALFLYKDGVLIGSSLCSAPTPNLLKIGQFWYGGTINGFINLIDQFRIFNRTLSQEEVEILYNEKPNDTTEEGLVAYYPLDINANDTAGTYEGTATGVTFDGDSAYFNGTSSQISVPSIVSKFNTQNIFGVSLWFKGTQTSIPVGLFSVRGLVSESVIFLISLNRTVAGELALDVGTSGNFIVLGRYNGAYNNGGWHHVYADIDFITKAFNLYADGVKIAGGTNASMLKSTSASYAYIGCNYLSQYFAGNLDEVRIYERALTAQEVSDIYNYGR